MNFKGKILLLAFFGLVVLKSFSQQSPLYTQYMFNGLLINPAYAGSQESLSMTALYRKQWMGIDGAPSTQTFSAHTPLKNQKIALGATFLNDYIGVTHQYGFDGVYAYRIQISEKSKLSFGLQAGAGRFVTNYASLPTRDQGDPLFSSNQSTPFSLNFGTGVYYYTPKFFAGLSAPRLLNTAGNSSISAGKNSRVYLFTTGYVFQLSPDLKLKPSTLIKVMNGVPMQIDLNCNLLIKEVLWVGASYRSFTSLSFIGQAQLTDQLRLGYAYDSSIGKTSGVLGGSHEFVLTYNFNFFGSKVVSPRYF